MQKTTAFGFPLPGRNPKLPFIMKVSLAAAFSLLVFTQLLTAGVGYAQRIEDKLITLELRNVSLRQALNRVERLTGYHMTYILEQVGRYRNISLSKETRSVAGTLQLLLSGTELDFKQDNNTILIFPSTKKILRPVDTKATAVDTVMLIRGKVTDENGKPLGYVSVSVKGTNKGTATDANGEFRIEAGAGDILVFSLVGYKAIAVTVGNDDDIAVKMELNVSGLGEVVVVGYGTQRRGNLTGAVATVNASQLSDRPVTSVQNALQGVVPGLTVLNRPGDVGNDIGNITVRGRTNLEAPGPMIIIDGIPVSAREFASLNPHDIASMSVLKDASSASIYGARAANGVILITTKKGTVNKLSIELNASYGIQSPTRRFEYLGSSEYAMLFNEAMRNASKPERYTADEIEKFESGSDPDLYPNTDWYNRALVKNPSIKDVQVAVSGSSKTTRYYLSLGAFNQESLVKNKDHSRYMVRLNTETQVLPILKVGSNISFIKQDFDTKGGEINWTSLNRLVPSMVAVHSDGTWGTVNGGKADATLAKINQLRFMAEGGKRWNRDHNIQTAVNAVLTPVKGLTVTGQASLKYDNRTEWRFWNEMPALVNFITKQPMPSTAYTPNEMQERWSSQQEFLMQGFAEYETTIKAHQAKIMAGASQESNIYRQVYVGRKRFFNNDLGTVGAGSSDPADISTDPIATGQPNGANTSRNEEWALRSFFGRVNYAFAGKYLLEGNLRVDLSSRFHPDHRTAQFPSLSAGWKISEESFMKNITWLNSLKLRGSWGILGNQENVNPGNYIALLSTGYAYNFDGVPVDGVWQKQGVNILASWEKVNMKNIGVDASLWNGLLEITADYFIKTTRDILLPTPAGATYGLTAPTKNLGSTENKGIELLLSHANSIGKDFHYYASFNFSKVKNTILNLGADKQRINSYWIEKVGESVGAFYGYEAEGLFKDAADVTAHATQSASTKPGDIKYKDQNKDGKINQDDRVVIGNDVPSFNYGFSLGASYKGFDVSVLAYGVQDVKVYLNAEASTSFFNGAGVKPLHLKRWTTDNPDPNAAYPRILITADGKHNYNETSSFWLFSGSYLRIRSISLGYNIPGDIAKKAAMQSARIYVAANNPFTIMKDKRLSDYDPEMASGRGGYPGIKAWTVGINVKF